MNAVYWITWIFLIGAVSIGSISCYLVASRKTTAYSAVRRVFIVAFLAGLIRISLEGLKLIPDFQEYVFAYDLLTNVLEQVFVIMSATTAAGLYLESKEVSIDGLLRKISTNKGLSILLYSIIGYSIAVSGYIFVARPYVLEKANTLWGYQLLTVFYPKSFLVIISPNVLVLIVGISYLLFASALRTKNKELRKNLLYLGFSDLLVGLGFLAFATYQNFARVDPEFTMYFLLSLLFSASAVSFNRASIYAGLLPGQNTVGESLNHEFSKQLNFDDDTMIGRQLLLEVDPNTGYERDVSSFCREFLASGFTVIVVTARSSAIYHILSSQPEIRFFLFSGNVSRPTAIEGEEGKMLIPQDSLMEVIELLERMLAQSGNEGKFALVFDNLSDRVISVGLERTYKSLKEMFAILGDRNVTVLFLVHPGTLDRKALNIIRSLFTIILESKRDRLTIMKE
ncbi:MAG: hypothetical protein JRN15_16140 [Nitrososphaerota archaeon]|nr:hypothetical protein [Nitrososphaerota archaeon]